MWWVAFVREGMQNCCHGHCRRTSEAMPPRTSLRDQREKLGANVLSDDRSEQRVGISVVN
jgi:hypothetical protein